MKKFLFSALIAFCFNTNTFASFEVRTSLKKATEIFLPVGKNMQISLMDLSVINVKDFEKLTGKHLNFIDRIEFKAAQKKLRNSISADGTISNKRLLKYMDDGDVTFWDKFFWFSKGLLFGPIGVLLAYIMLKDERRELIKWAWFGFIGFTAFVVALILAF